MAKTVLTPEQREKLAREIIDLLRDYELLFDVCIYYNHRCEILSGDFRQIKDDIDVRDYFEYGNPETVSLSFEGPLYRVFNDFANPEFLEKFNALIKSYGMYYELGHAWNLSLYSINWGFGPDKEGDADETAL